MQEISSVLSKSYSPEAVTENVTVAFTKVTNSDGTVVSGRVTKQGKEAATVNYYGKNDSLVVSVRPLAALDGAELSALFNAVPGYINEILSE